MECLQSVHTALVGEDEGDVYNLVLSDTIEGKIFLLLDDKLKEIAKALGKVDEQGNVAEDLRGQVLGQLSERLTYDKLYREALSDPELRRTKEELEAAHPSRARAASSPAWTRRPSQLWSRMARPPCDSRPTATPRVSAAMSSCWASTTPC